MKQFAINRSERGWEMKNQTFILKINDIQNRSWQGQIKWVQGQKKQSFRSALELLQLLHSVVEENDPEIVGKEYGR